MKYNKKEIMKRAWEIKKEADRKAKNDIAARTGCLRELRPEEKAIFGECLKAAWKEVNRAEVLTEELNISMGDALRLAQKEYEISLGHDYGVTWKLWSNYGKKRAYFRVASWSNYANNKSYNFVELA